MLHTTRGLSTVSEGGITFNQILSVLSPQSALTFLAYLLAWISVIVVICLIVISSVEDVLDHADRKGIPLLRKLGRRIREKRFENLRDMLRELGLYETLPLHRQVTEMVTIEPVVGEETYRRDVLEICKKHFSEGSVTIGRVAGYEFGYFIDLMSACTDPFDTERLARALSSFIRDEMRMLDPGKPILYDKILVPKDGSVTVGFLLSKILKKPCVFFRGLDDPKIRHPYKPEYFFDGVVSRGDIFILVDDSTTGGRMMVEAASKVREIGGDVKHAFVLFEPIGKGARSRLQENGIELHAITLLDDSFISALRQYP